MNSQIAASPLTELESSKEIDASIVFVLASAQKARKLGDNTVWIRGVGWSSDTPVVEDRDLARAEYVEQAVGRAYKMANVRSPASYFDLAEVDDTYSYKELQTLEALKLASKGKAGKMVDTGTFDVDGRLPVNASGGSLGVGHLLEATGLHRTLEAVLDWSWNLLCDNDRAQATRLAVFTPSFTVEAATRVGVLSLARRAAALTSPLPRATAIAPASRYPVAVSTVMPPVGTSRRAGSGWSRWRM